MVVKQPRAGMCRPLGFSLCKKEIYGFSLAELVVSFPTTEAGRFGTATCRIPFSAAPGGRACWWR